MLSSPDGEDSNDALSQAVAACGSDAALSLFSIEGHQEVLMTNLDPAPKPCTLHAGMGFLLRQDPVEVRVQLVYLLPWREPGRTEAELCIEIEIQGAPEDDPGALFLERLAVPTVGCPKIVTADVKGTMARLSLTWTAC